MSRMGAKPESHDRCAFRGAAISYGHGYGANPGHEPNHDAGASRAPAPLAP
jgi:hypothetical protein